MFGWTPQVTNYSQSLVSKSITGDNSTILTLSYDIYLDNFATTTVNQMAVELWDGTTWHLLKNYDNTKEIYHGLQKLLISLPIQT